MQHSDQHGAPLVPCLDESPITGLHWGFLMVLMLGLKLSS